MSKLITFLNMNKLFNFRSITTRISADGKDISKKQKVDSRITLIGTDNSVSITDLQNALNLSSRRELKLVKIQDIDAKTRRPIYKIMTNAQYHEEELSKRKDKQTSRINSKKGQKLISLSSKIEEHDLITYGKKIAKLLEKNHEVRIVVSGEEKEGTKVEKISTIIEKNIKSVGKIVQMRQKGNNMHFSLLPTKKSSDGAKIESNDKQNDDNNEPL